MKVKKFPNSSRVISSIGGGMAGGAPTVAAQESWSLPGIKSCSIANHEVNVAVDASIVVRFTKDMALNSAAITIPSATLEWTPVITWDNQRQITISHVADWDSEGAYGMTLTAHDMNMRELAEDEYTIRWSCADVIHPAIDDIDPPTTTTDVDPDEDIVIEFTENMDTTSLAVTTDLPNPVYAWDLADEVLTISHDTLDSETTYHITALTCDDPGGNALDPAWVGTYNFTTADVIRPTITGTFPVDGWQYADIDGNIRIYFSEDMDVTPGSVSFTGLPAATVSWNGGGDELTINPNAALTANTEYTVTITDAVDPAGNHIAAPYAFTFRTEAADAPTIVSVTPADLATDVAINSPIIIEFDKPMHAQPEIFTFTVTDSVQGLMPIRSVGWNESDTTVTITCDANFTSEGHVVVVLTSAEDTHNHDLAGLPVTVSSFDCSDVIAPTVIGVSPTLGATFQSTTPTIVVNFSEKMKGTGTGFVTDPAYTGVANLAWNAPANDQLVITNITLPLDTDVDLSITSPDEADNEMAAPYEWMFTTEPTVRPIVLTTVPEDDVIDVPVTQEIVVTFNGPIDDTSFTYTCVGSSSGPRTTPTVNWNGAFTAVTLGGDDFASEETVTVTITHAEDLHGHQLQPTPYAFDFDTIA